MRLARSLDSYGKLIEVIQYDNCNRQIRSGDALGNHREFAYDALGRQISTTEYLTGAVVCVTCQTYDGVGNILTKTDSNGNVTSFEYDNLDRPKKITSPDDTPNNSNDNPTVEYTYDLNGNVLTQKTGSRIDATMTFNVRNLMATRKDAAGKLESFEYYADGTLATKIDRNGVATVYEYDIHGHVLNENTGGEVISYTYDSNGNRKTVTNVTGQITRVYDELNRVVKKTVPIFGETKFIYDVTTGIAQGFTAEKTEYPGGAVTTKVFDKAGRLSEVIDGGASTTYEYYDNGSLKKLSYPGNLTEEYTYYVNNKMHTLTNKRGSTILDAYNVINIKPYYFHGEWNYTIRPQKNLSLKSNSCKCYCFILPNLMLTFLATVVIQKLQRDMSAKCKKPDKVCPEGAFLSL